MINERMVNKNRIVKRVLLCPPESMAIHITISQ